MNAPGGAGGNGPQGNSSLTDLPPIDRIGHVLPVPDPQGISGLPFLDNNNNIRPTYGAYPRYLADHMDNIRSLNGGRAGPEGNMHLSHRDRE